MFEEPLDLKPDVENPSKEYLGGFEAYTRGIYVTGNPYELGESAESDRQRLEWGSGWYGAYRQHSASDYSMAYDEGKAAYQEGKGRGANPYDREKNERAHRRWDQGWCVARVEDV